MISNQTVISVPISQAKEAEERHRHLITIGDRAINLA